MKKKKKCFQLEQTGSQLPINFSSFQGSGRSLLVRVALVTIQSFYRDMATVLRLTSSAYTHTVQQGRENAR